MVHLGGPTPSSVGTANMANVSVNVSHFSHRPVHVRHHGCLQQRPMTQTDQ